MPPKRKPTGKNDGDKPSKRAKPNDEEEDKDLEEDITASLQRKNAGKFELATGSLDPPKLNVKDPGKLDLHFREIATGKEETLTFQRIPSDSIVWGDKSHIDKIQRWRRQALLRRGFPSDREVTTWQPREEAFLELLFQSLQDRVEDGEQVRRPTTGQVTDYFNAFFKGKQIEDKHGNKLPPRSQRNEDMINSKLRPNNKLGEFVKPIKESLSTNKKLVVDLPTITDHQLDEFVGKLSSTARPTRRVVNNRGTKKITKEVQQTGAGLDINTVPSEFPDVTDKNTEGTDDQDPSEITDSDTPSNKRSKRHPRRPTDQPANITPHDEIARMHKDGWFIPTVSKDVDATEASEDDKDTLNDEWMYKAVDCLHDRWTRSKTNEFGYFAPLADTHKWVSYDPIGRRAAWYKDKGPVSARRQYAQAANAILGLAICPPVGFGGDINNLARRRVEGWGKFDLALAKENERALKFHHEKHNAQFDKYYREHVRKRNASRV